MDAHDFEPTREIIDSALDDAVAAGWLSPVTHGFCFYCNEEKAVYDVTMANAPVQPPRCGDCFFAIAASVRDNPERWSHLFDGDGPA